MQAQVPARSRHSGTVVLGRVKVPTWNARELQAVLKVVNRERVRLGKTETDMDTLQDLEEQRALGRSDYVRRLAEAATDLVLD